MQTDFIPSTVVSERELGQNCSNIEKSHTKPSDKKVHGVKRIEFVTNKTKATNVNDGKQADSRTLQETHQEMR